MARRVTLLQIAANRARTSPPTSELRAGIEREAGNINARSPSRTGRPLRLIARAGRAQHDRGLHARGPGRLVTPLRDGMNLVAKEYVAAQDPQDPGVLVLSRFAGAARQLSPHYREPYDADELADALDRR